MIFEVFAFTTPKVKVKETIMDEVFGDKEGESNSEEFALDKVDMEVKGQREDEKKTTMAGKSKGEKNKHEENAKKIRKTRRRHIKEALRPIKGRYWK